MGSEDEAKMKAAHVRHQHTICLWPQVRHQVANANVDDAKKALVLLLEFLLVEHLYGEDATFVGPASKGKTVSKTGSSASKGAGRGGRTSQNSHSNMGSASSC